MALVKLGTLSCLLDVTSQSAMHMKSAVKDAQNYIAVAAQCARVK